MLEPRGQGMEPGGQGVEPPARENLRVVLTVGGISVRLGKVSLT